MYKCGCIGVRFQCEPLWSARIDCVYTRYIIIILYYMRFPSIDICSGKKKPRTSDVLKYARHYYYYNTKGSVVYVYNDFQTFYISLFQLLLRILLRNIFLFILFLLTR